MVMSRHNANVGGCVKLGAKTSNIIHTNIGKYKTKDDTVVVCTGSNDTSKNKAKEALKR
jgi:hypothetical protein